MMKRIRIILSIMLMLALTIGAAVIPAAAADAPSAGQGAEEPASEEPVEQEQVEVNAAVSEELEAKMNAPQTFDFSIVAAVIAAVSLAGFAFAKKK